MKPPRRNDRSQSDVTRRDTQPPSSKPPATPEMDGPRPEVPSEFIDLRTGPFREAFPDLAKESKKRAPRSRRPRPQPPKPDGSGGGNG